VFFYETDDTQEALYLLHIVGSCNLQDCFNLLVGWLEHCLFETEPKGNNLLGTKHTLSQVDLNIGFLQLMKDFIQDNEMTAEVYFLAMENVVNVWLL
jgi:hypothetical protein